MSIIPRSNPTDFSCWGVEVKVYLEFGVHTDPAKDNIYHWLCSAFYVMFGHRECCVQDAMLIHEEGYSYEVRLLLSPKKKCLSSQCFICQILSCKKPQQCHISPIDDFRNNFFLTGSFPHAVISPSTEIDKHFS
ncbi:hypothetical protein AVEN_109011-1 [Araneus ventricosus]|uniref:Uncharacterized protein n=1 Tax=Araneus ventricosus TaxID=182803 RepID=A0A4Y1ZZP2_ARAVE|nr:hypothetical protein AVEN_109011-1 [Araneus ventricosus]